MTTARVRITNWYFKNAFLKISYWGSLWTCVPSQGHEGPEKVRKQPQDTKQERKPHEALSEQAPFHLEGKHITDYLACVEATEKFPLMRLAGILYIVLYTT